MTHAGGKYSLMLRVSLQSCWGYAFTRAGGKPSLTLGVSIKGIKYQVFALLALIDQLTLFFFVINPEWDTPQRLATANTNCEIAKRAR